MERSFGLTVAALAEIRVFHAVKLHLARRFGRQEDFGLRRRDARGPELRGNDAGHGEAGGVEKLEVGAVRISIAGMEDHVTVRDGTEQVSASEAEALHRDRRIAVHHLIARADVQEDPRLVGHTAEPCDKVRIREDPRGRTTSSILVPKDHGLPVVVDGAMAVPMDRKPGGYHGLRFKDRGVRDQELEVELSIRIHPSRRDVENIGDPGFGNRFSGGGR